MITPPQAPRIGDISRDLRLGLLVVWTGKEWKTPESLTPDEYLTVIRGK